MKRYPKLMVAAIFLAASVGILAGPASGGSCARLDPCNLRLNGTNATGVDLIWDAPHGLRRFGHYDLLRQGPGETAYRSIASIQPASLTSYSDGGLMPATTYAYRVLQIDAWGAVLGASNELWLTTPTDEAAGPTTTSAPTTTTTAPTPTTTTAPTPTTTTSTTTTTTPAPTTPAPVCDQTLSGTMSFAGFTVPAGQTWCFSPGATTTVESSANVVVNGTLVMRPANAAVRHTLRFVSVNEAKFIGGGDDVLASDVGLWVMGAGRLDVAGTPKLPWTRAQAVSKGASTITTTEAPAGWAVGDEVTIAPTVAPTYPNHSQAYDPALVTAVAGNTVSLSAPTAHPHPAVAVTPARTARPEVLNLTRNARIEGTPAGRSHIFIRSTSSQSVRHAQVRYMGPRKPNAQYAYLNRGYSLKVLGRYGLHLHKSGAGSEGSVVEGVVMRDNGNHSFVPHQSHGVTLRQNIAHDVMETAYWWDPGAPTDGVTLDRNVASKVSSDELSWEDFVELSGFWIGEGGPPGPGAMNVATGNVAVGVAGGVRASGYIWPANSEGIWRFEDNDAHNNREDGVFFWQTTAEVHPVARFLAYHNGRYGVFQGGYGANAQWSDTVLYGNGAAQLFGHGTVMIADTANLAPRQRWNRATFDGAGISPYAVLLAGDVIPPDGIDWNVPAEINNSTLRGYTQAAVRVERFAEGRDNGALWRLTGNDYGPGKRFSFTNDIPGAARIEVSSVAESYTLRRFDQPGTYIAEWNARKG